MTPLKIKQHDVNQVCEALRLNGEKITIRSVKNLLGKGSYSEIAQCLELYRSNKQKALTIAKNESNAIEPEPTPPQKADSLTQSIQDLIASITPEDQHPERITLQVRELLQEHIEQLVETRTAKLNKEKRTIELKFDHLETQFLNLTSRYQKLMAHNQRLEDHIQLSRQISNDIIKESRRDEENPVKKIKVESTHAAQIDKLQGLRKAAYNQSNKKIILKIHEFHAALHKVLNAGKQGIMQATATYNYKTKFWELTQYTTTTIKFLVQNGFDISEELHQRFRELTKQAD